MCGRAVLEDVCSKYGQESAPRSAERDTARAHCSFAEWWCNADHLVVVACPSGIAFRTEVPVALLCKQSAAWASTCWDAPDHGLRDTRSLPGTPRRGCRLLGRVRAAFPLEWPLFSRQNPTGGPMRFARLTALALLLLALLAAPLVVEGQSPDVCRGSELSATFGHPWRTCSSVH